MKKMIFLLFVAMMLLILCACDGKKLSEKETYLETSTETKEKLSVNSFCKKVNGFWGYEHDDGQWEILEFANGKINDYTYAGHIWISDGNIDYIEEISDDSVRINISYQEIVYGEDTVPGKTQRTEYILKSNDEFVNHLMKDDWEYIYLCENKDTLDATISKLSYPNVSQSDIILNREVFIFKNDFPQLYTAGVNDMNFTKPYRENWRFNKILNDSNYKNIEWSIEKITDKVDMIIFSGENTFLSYKNNVIIEFYVQDGAKIPLAWSMKIIAKGKTTDLGVEQFENQGMDMDMALMLADAEISTMLVLMTDINSDYNQNKKSQNNVELTQEELVGIAQKNLGVPEGDDITYIIGERHFWESGQCYNVRIDFYEKGNFVASTYIDTASGEFTHGIYSYTPYYEE